MSYSGNTSMTSTSPFSYIVPIFSSFFGALAAFSFAAIRERIRERERRLGTINAAIYGLLMSMATLLNLKKQSLSAFKDQFSEIRETIGHLNPLADTAQIKSVLGRIGVLFAEIGKTDPQLNCAFKKWQVPDFPMMPTPQDLAFTLHGAPDLVRLVHVGKIEASQVTRRIEARNELWDKKEAEIQKEAIEGSPGHKTLLFYYEMLDLRELALAHVNTALVVINEALTQLDAFRKKHVPKRNWLLRHILGREHWITYKTQEQWKNLLPDPANFRDVLFVASEEKN